MGIVGAEAAMWATSFLSGISTYIFRDSAKAMDQDGRQEIASGALATTRLSYLSTLMLATTPPLAGVAAVVSSVSFLPLGLGVLAAKGRVSEDFLSRQNELLSENQFNQLNTNIENFTAAISELQSEKLPNIKNARELFTELKTAKETRRKTIESICSLLDKERIKLQKGGETNNEDVTNKISELIQQLSDDQKSQQIVKNLLKTIRSIKGNVSKNRKVNKLVKQLKKIKDQDYEEVQFASGLIGADVSGAKKFTYDQLVDKRALLKKTHAFIKKTLENSAENTEITNKLTEMTNAIGSIKSTSNSRRRGLEALAGASQFKAYKEFLKNLLTPKEIFNKLQEQKNDKFIQELDDGSLKVSNDSEKILEYIKKLFNKDTKYEDLNKNKQSAKLVFKFVSKQLEKDNLNQDYVDVLRSIQSMTDVNSTKAIPAIELIRKLFNEDIIEINQLDERKNKQNKLNDSYKNLLNEDKKIRKQAYRFVSKILMKESALSNDADQELRNRLDMLNSLKRVMETECSKIEKVYNYALKYVGKTAGFIVANTHMIIDVASAVAYVAMIALGFTVPGVIGLIGLALAMCKLSGIMPAKIHSTLEILGVLSMLVSGILLPLNIIVRVIQSVLAVIFAIEMFSNAPFVKKCLPPLIVGKHHMREQEKALEELYKEDNQKALESLINQNVYGSSLNDSLISSLLNKDILESTSLNSKVNKGLTKLMEASDEERQKALTTVQGMLKIKSRDLNKAEVKSFKLLLKLTEKALQEKPRENLHNEIHKQRFTENRDFDDLTLNRSSIFNDEILGMLPSVDRNQPEEVFQKVEKKIMEYRLNEDSEFEYEGFNNLKEAVLKGKSASQISPNFDAMKGAFVKMFENILEYNQENFQTSIKEICRRGKQCPAAYTELLGDYGVPLGIHAALAEFRERLVRELGSETINRTGKNAASAVGGSNNVHVNDAFQKALYSYFNTTCGLRKKVIGRRGILIEYLDKKFLQPPKEGEKLTTVQKVYGFFRRMGMMHFECTSLTFLHFSKDFRDGFYGRKATKKLKEVPSIFDRFNARYTKESIIDNLLSQFDQGILKEKVFTDLYQEMQEKYVWLQRPISEEALKILNDRNIKNDKVGEFVAIGAYDSLEGKLKDTAKVIYERYEGKIIYDSEEDIFKCFQQFKTELEHLMNNTISKDLLFTEIPIGPSSSAKVQKAFTKESLIKMCGEELGSKIESKVEEKRKNDKLFGNVENSYQPVDVLTKNEVKEFCNSHNLELPSNFDAAQTYDLEVYEEQHITKRCKPTRKMVELMLWHLGILEMRKDAV